MSSSTRSAHLTFLSLAPFLRANPDVLLDLFNSVYLLFFLLTVVPVEVVPDMRKSKKQERYQKRNKRGFVLARLPRPDMLVFLFRLSVFS